MISVDGDEEGVVFLEHITERFCDALWEKDGDTGAYADELDVRDGVKA